MTFHTLRHSMASLALNAGIPESTVQLLGNWKTRKMVSRYAHLADRTKRAAAAKLIEIVGAPEADGDGEDGVRESGPGYETKSPANCAA